MTQYLNKQKGAATLFVAVILIISISLVSFYTAKVVLNQTRVEANTYRAVQALNAADAAIDFVVGYHGNGGLDHDGDGSLDDDGSDSSDDDFGLSSDGYSMAVSTTSTGQTTYANVVLDNNNARCSTESTMDSALVTATGVSDDQVATRTVSICLGVIPLLKDGGPEQPLVSKGQVNLTGSAAIINRYTNVTVWAGDVVEIGSSNAMETYTCDAPCDATTEADKIDTDKTSDTQKVSTHDLGNGYDVIDSDPALGGLSGDDFFNNFFVLSRSAIESAAKANGHHYASGNVSDSVNGASGPIWVDGDATLNGNNTIGSINSPAIVYINGDLNLGGGFTIYGILYVVDQLDVAGTPAVIGSSIVEGASVPSGEDPVEGSGTVDIVFAPDIVGRTAENPIGRANIVEGSWRDW